MLNDFRIAPCMPTIRILLPAIAGLLVVLATLSCRSDREPDLPIGVIRPAGRATGTFQSITIGPAGGRVMSLDGRAELIVPPEAVSGEVNMALQPIENTAPL